MQHPGTVQLRIVVGGCIDSALFLPRRGHLHDQFLIHGKIAQLRLHKRRLQSQQFPRLLQQNALRQITVPLRSRQHKRIEQPAPDPKIRVRVNTDLRRDLVRDLKSDPVNVLRKLVRVLLENAVYPGPVSLIDAESKGVGNPVFL